MPRLEGKTAFITGGGTGIGRACAVLFAREGARVAIVGLRREPLESVAREIRGSGGECCPLCCDVTQPEQVEQAFPSLLQRWTPLHIVVNNAGVLHVGDAEHTSDADWHRVISTNLTGTFLVSRAAIPELRRAGGGSIVNIGSVLGLVAMKLRAAYAASKGGVTQLTKAMALDHAHEKIRVNCICPAVVETELVARILQAGPDPQAARRSRIEQIPLGRLGTPQDVAQLALFLASDESSWITGAALPLDGGLSAY